VTVVVQDLVVTHRDRVLIEVPGLRLEPGRAVTVVGESGSGKSLLAHAVMGTLAPGLTARGRLVLDGAGHDVADQRGRRRLWGRVLALLPQEPVLALDPTMRVLPQVAEGVRGAPDRGAARSTAAGLLAGLGLHGEERAWPHTLSGGMAQRVAFAAATVGGASVLLADEPSKGLDTRARDELAGLLRRHVEGGGVLLTITHDLALARALGGDVVVTHGARVLEQGPVEEVLTRPSDPWTQRLVAADPAGWPRRSGPDSAGSGSVSGEVLVDATDLALCYGDKRLVDDLSLRLHRGERVALTGPSGSGKTTLGDVLLALREPQGGTVRRSPALDGGRRQKLYQDPAVAFPPRVPLGAGLGDVLRRHRVPAGRFEDLLGALRLDPGLLARRPGEVSGGELQRLAVARAVVLDPVLLFADEPTSRLDLVTQQETMGCLLEQVERHDCALLLVTHDVALAEAVTDRSVPVGPGAWAAEEREAAPVG